MTGSASYVPHTLHFEERFVLRAAMRRRLQLVISAARGQSVPPGPKEIKFIGRFKARVARRRHSFWLIAAYLQPHAPSSVRRAPGQEVGSRLSTATVQPSSPRSTLTIFRAAAGDQVIDVFVTLAAAYRRQRPAGSAS